MIFTLESLQIYIQLMYFLYHILFKNIWKCNIYQMKKTWKMQLNKYNSAIWNNNSYENDILYIHKFLIRNMHELYIDLMLQNRLIHVIYIFKRNMSSIMKWNQQYGFIWIQYFACCLFTCFLYDICMDFISISCCKTLQFI